MKKLRLLTSNLQLYELRLLKSTIREDSNLIKQQVEADKNFIDYFIELYDNYLVPDNLVKGYSKKCYNGFLYQTKEILIDPYELFKPLISETENSLITRQKYFRVDKPIIIYHPNKSICDELNARLTEDEKLTLKNLYSISVELDYKINEELKDINRKTDKIKTWNDLYKFSPELYEKLYKYLSEEGDYSSAQKTKFDKEINDTADINTLLNKIINYINRNGS